VAQRESSPIKIAILGGDLLVSRSLEVALQGAGYDACYLNGSFTGEQAELPEGVRLVIFAPRMGGERRKAFLSNIRSSAATAGLPVLELATVLEQARAEQEGVDFVAWPCPTEELVRRIEAALLEGEGADPEPDSNPGEVRAWG
jgi:DNA-binding response OmpR family regulator